MNDWEYLDDELKTLSVRNQIDPNLDRVDKIKNRAYQINNNSVVSSHTDSIYLQGYVDGAANTVNEILAEMRSGQFNYISAADATRGFYDLMATKNGWDLSKPLGDTLGDE